MVTAKLFPVVGVTSKVLFERVKTPSAFVHHSERRGNYSGFQLSALKPK